MNILLLALGSHGDVHPFVGIGLRLRERGHHVAVAANAYFKPLIDHANLEFVEMGSAERYRTLATNPDLWHPRRSTQAVFSAVMEQIRPMYELTVEFCKRPDAVVAASSLSLGARVAQDKFDLPVATVHLSPSIFLSAEITPVLPGLGRMKPLPRWARRRVINFACRVFDWMLLQPLNDFRAELGLAKTKWLVRDYWHSPRRVIGMFPAWYAPPQSDWPANTRLTGFPLYDEPDLTPISPELETFLGAGPPPIAFTPGSAMWQAHAFFAASIDACVRAGRRGILLTRHTEHLPRRLPEGVIHAHYAPFSELLPRCAALVHHGGIGTSAQALRAGVPQLVTPFAHDQPDNAARLQRLGVAEVLKTNAYGGKAVAETLTRLLDSEDVRRACKEVQSRFAGIDPLGQTCDLIEALHPGSTASAVTAEAGAGTA